MSSMNHADYPHDMDYSYGNTDVGPNQPRRIAPMPHPTAYPNQAQNGPQVMPSLQEGHRMAMNQRLQPARPKILFTRQQYQAYNYPGHVTVHSSNQMSTQQYPYCGVTYMPASSGQVPSEYSGVENNSRIVYSQGCVRRPLAVVRMQKEEKPSPLSYSNPQLNSQHAVSNAVYIKEDAVEESDAIYHYGVEGSDWICIRTIAVLIGESGFKPFSGVQITKNCLSFAIVLQDKNKNIMRTSLLIEDHHITELALCECSKRKYVLAILLNELGRDALHPQLQWVERIKSYDLVFSCDLLHDFQTLHAKLSSFFVSKFKYFASPSMHQNRDLVYSAILVARYARFLEKAERRQKTEAKTEDQSLGSGDAAVSSEQNVLSIELPQAASTHNRVTKIVEKEVKVEEEESFSDAVFPPRNDFTTSALQQSFNAVCPGDDELVSLERLEEHPFANCNQEEVTDTAYMVEEEATKEWSKAAANDGSDESNREESSMLPETCSDVQRSDITKSFRSERYMPAYKKRMSAAEYLRTFCSPSINDFPDDFLAPEASSKPQISERKPSNIQPVDHSHVELTLDDDDYDKEEPTSLKFDGNVTVEVGSIRQSMPRFAFMTGSLATFYFKHYIPYVALKDDFRKDKICFLDSDNYVFIRRKCEKEFRNLDEELTAEKAVAVFGRRKKKKELHPFIMSLVQFELIVMPLFWDNHWYRLLGLLQIFPSSGEVVERQNSCRQAPWTHMLFKDSLSGRLLLVDSKFDDPINKVVLEKISESIHSHISIAIKAALVTSEKPRRLKDFDLIRCDSLPCQTNNSDCGWFMCLFAEHYTKNINWMALSNEDVCHMSLSEVEEEQFHNRLAMIKREVGAYMEKAAKRPLNFEYDKVVMTPNTQGKKGWK